MVKFHMVPWRRADQAPTHLQQVLIIINGQICLDVYSFDAKKVVFTTPNFYQKDVVQLRVKLNEIEAWVPIGDIKLPHWVSKRMENAS